MCEMCGSEERSYKAEVEGTILNVCRQCAKFGRIISEIKPQAKEPKKKTYSRPEKQAKEEKNLIYIVSEDFAEKIRKKREKSGLNQEEFAKKISEKESVIHNLETGVLTPSLKLARKLEMVLGISLIEVYEETGNHTLAGEKTELTIGDMIKIKKK